MPRASWKSIVQVFGVALIACGTSQGQGVSFNSPKDYSVGRGPTALVVADFDADGNLDVAVTDASSGSVAVLLGNGKGNFKPALNFAAGVSPTAIAVADFNHDGKPDLVIADAYNEPKMAVLLGNGDGSFQAPIQVSLSSLPSSVAVGDFNGDGKLDVAVALSSSNKVAVLLGNGDGTLQSPTTIAVGSGPSSVVAADFNGDGKTDLAVADSGAGDVEVLIGNGDGTFQAPASFFSGGTNPVALAVSDFNDDGKPDLAVSIAVSSYGEGNLSVLLGRGDGTFQSPLLTSSLVVETSALVVGDFNNDGKPDVAMSGWAGTGLTWGVSLFLGNGDGTFHSATAVTLGTAFGLAAGDFNGDGRLDLAGASYNVVQVRLNEGNGVFPSPKNYPTASADVNWFVAADFNSDGALDVATANRDSDSISVLLNKGDGSFQPPIRFSAGGQPVFLVAGDFNGDGKPDIAAAMSGYYGSGPLAIFLGHGDGTFQPGQQFAPDIKAIMVAAGDFNGDGKLDLVALNYSDVMVFLGNGDGTFQSPLSYPNYGWPMTTMTVADFNGDGKLDIAVFNCETNTISILLGNGDGTFRAAINTVWLPRPDYIAAADLNGDGKIDLISGEYNPGTRNAKGTLQILLGNGDGTFKTPTDISVPNATLSPVIADFNHDGKPDIAISSAFSGDVTILLGKGDGTFLAGVNFATAGPVIALVAGDFNHDGKTDIAGMGGVGALSILTNTVP